MLQMIQVTESNTWGTIVFITHNFILFFNFNINFLSFSLVLSHWPGADARLASQLLESSCFYLPNTRIMGACHCIRYFNAGSGGVDLGPHAYMASSYYLGGIFLSFSHILSANLKSILPVHCPKGNIPHIDHFTKMLSLWPQASPPP